MSTLIESVVAVLKAHDIEHQLDTDGNIEISLVGKSITITSEFEDDYLKLNACIHTPIAPDNTRKAYKLIRMLNDTHTNCFYLDPLNLVNMEYGMFTSEDTLMVSQFLRLYNDFSATLNQVEKQVCELS